MKKFIYILLLISFGFIQGSSLDSYLKKELSEYKKFTYKIISLPIGIKSITDANIKIDNSRNFRLVKGFAYVPIKIKKRGNRFSRAFVTVRVKLFADVWVAKSKIKRNENLTSDRFNLVQKEISNLNDNIISSKMDLSNYRAAKTIVKGSILNNNMLSKIPIVFRGDRLFAYSVFGSVVVNFSVNAREDGSKGDIIRVVRSDKKLFKAKIINSKKVKIVE